MAVTDTQQDTDMMDPFLGPIGQRRGIQIYGPDGQPITPGEGGSPSLPGDIWTMMGDQDSPTEGGGGASDPTTGGGADPTPDTGGAPRKPSTGGLGKDAEGNPSVDPTGQLAAKQTPPATTNTGGGGDNGLADLIASLLAAQRSNADNLSGFRAGLQRNIDQALSDARRPVSARDPEIAGPTTAFNAQGQRARALMQEQLAQEAAAGGKPTGAVDQAVKASFENLGNATGSYEASLMRDELSQRRDMLKSMLTAGIGVMSSEQQTALQEELAAINAKIAETTLKQGNTQFYDKLSTDLGEHTNSLDSLLAALLGGGGA